MNPRLANGSTVVATSECRCAKERHAHYGLTPISVKAPRCHGTSIKTQYLGMNNEALTLTLEFQNKSAYREFILDVRQLKPRRSSYHGVLHGTARIYIRREQRPMTISLLSRGAFFDVLFNLKMLLRIKTTIIRDFSIPSSTDFLTAELVKCLKRCITTSAAWIDDAEDPETLHDFRLAIRAFRSLLSILQKIGITGLDDLRDTTRNLARSSNEIRDMDVRIGLYEKFNVPIPGTLNETRTVLSIMALDNLKLSAAETWFCAMRYIASYSMEPEVHRKFVRHVEKQTRKVAKRLRKVDFKDDTAIHQLRINMKKLSYGYTTLREEGDNLSNLAKSIKAVQSRLGDVRDLRKFYVLPGLEPETRYQAVQMLSRLEYELKALRIDP
ncbi:MAG: CHAD domain-containing protein [Erysipelotrichales bacterium]|nr:MAG: CHAD domain-containing protein [Erysipelotrichales bacterium]